MLKFLINLLLKNRLRYALFSRLHQASGLIFWWRLQLLLVLNGEVIKKLVVFWIDGFHVVRAALIQMLVEIFEDFYSIVIWLG